MTPSKRITAASLSFAAIALTALILTDLFGKACGAGVFVGAMVAYLMIAFAEYALDVRPSYRSTARRRAPWPPFGAPVAVLGRAPRAALEDIPEGAAVAVVEQDGITGIRAVRRRAECTCLIDTGGLPVATICAVHGVNDPWRDVP